MAEVHSIEIKVDSTQAQTASRNLDKMSGSASGAESALNNLTRAALGLVALDKIAGVAKGILDTNRAMEALRAQLVSVTGSAIGAQKAFTFIQNFATSTPYEIEGLTKAFIALQNYGIKPTKQVMEAVTNQASKLGGEQQTLEGIVRALGQAYAKGKLQAEEMLQLAERGVPVYDLLSQVTGKNAAQLQDMAQKGELTRDVLERLIGKMGELSSGANANAMDTLNGKISNLSDAWHQFEDALLNDKSEGIIKSIVDSITGQLSRMTAEINKSPVQKLEDQLASLRKTPGYDVPIAEVERQLASAKKAQEEQDKITAEQMKAEDARVAKVEEQRKKLLAGDGAVVKSKKEQTAATKALHEAEAAFSATIDANIRVAQNQVKVQEAQYKTAEKRLNLEMEQAKAAASIRMDTAKTDEDKLKIQEELAAKIESIIVRETELKQEQISLDEKIIATRIAGVEQEIASADRFNLSQAERIRLETELQALKAQEQIIPEERAQLEIDAMLELQNAYGDLNKLKAESADTEAKVREEALRTLEVLSSNLDYSREMATGLAEAFGEVGASIGGMTVALAEYEKQQATINIQAEEAIKKNPSKKMEIEAEAMTKQSRNQIKLYGDMTEAAQGFFKKGTKGYEAMGAAVKVFRVFEMAQSALSFAKQMGDMGAMLAQFLGMESAKTTAKIANNAAQQASDASGAVTSATKAVADAGQGDPYTGIIRAAAMLAFMAAIGIAVGGGGGGSSATSVKPPEPGTGTVKGDPLAVSESINKSIGIIEENSSNDLNYSADMLDALYQIRDALGGVENLIASDLTPAISNLMTKFGDGLKQAGFIFRDQQLSKVLASGKYEGYIGARVETESSQMMVTIKKGQTMVAEYGNRFAEAFGTVIKTIQNGIVETGKIIGVSESEIANRLKGFKIKGQTIDIAGLSAEEAAKKIEAAFSAMSDTMAMKALPEFKDFQQSGEGYFETIARVTEGVNRAKGSLELLGMEAIKYTDIIDKNKDVAAEITRQTIMAQGDLSEGTREYVRQLQGSAADIIDSYKQILSITNLMRGAGFATGGLDREMINAAGGLSAFEEALQSFRENFMTEEQRVTTDTADLIVAFGKLGLQLPKSKEDFYALAMGIDTSTSEGKKLFAQLMSLNGKFAEVTDAAKELADAQAEAAQQAADAARKAAEEAAAAAKRITEAYQSAFGFMDPAGKTNPQVDELKKIFSDLGQVMPDTVTGLKWFIDSMNQADPATKAIYDKIVLLAPAFVDAANAAANLAAKEEEAARKRRETYENLFYTPEEKLATQMNNLKKEFDRLGLSVPKTKDDFRKLVESLDTSTTQGKHLYDVIIGLAPAFSDAANQATSLADAARKAAEEQADAARKLAEEQAKALQDAMNQAFDAMKTSYKDLQAVQERFLNHAKTIRAYLNELTGARSAYISPEERYRLARAEFQRISTLAASGNEDALSLIISAGKDFIDASSQYNASNEQFQNDFATVTSALEASAGYAESQADMAGKQLKIAENSFSALVEINTSTLGVQAAISTLTSKMEAYLSASNAAGVNRPLAEMPISMPTPVSEPPPAGLPSDWASRPANNGIIDLGNGHFTMAPGLPGAGTFYANGGTASPGLAVVGEYGPELVSFGSTGYVSTAGATANFFKTIKDAVVITSAQQTELLKEQVAELQALVRLQSAASREMIKQLSEIRSETSEATRIAKVEASA